MDIFSNTYIFIGQYKLTVLIVRKCSTKEVINPHRYFGTFFEWHAGVFNSTGKTYIKGNYTVLKPVQNAKVRARNFIWEDDRWKLRIRIPGFGCYRQIFRLFIQALNVDVDISKCAVKPSPSVAVKKFDFNTVMHAWELEKEYGLWMWIFEITSSSKSTSLHN
ncbi:hypothetical protein ABMA28_011785 [Loxostege sticticalis]|uniref:Uncharacterized protein n=1 Tax=Loxostege sticticalis TaxID=481309 RepID=A0ABD0TKS4_LOXSC